MARTPLTRINPPARLRWVIVFTAAMALIGGAQSSWAQSGRRGGSGGRSVSGGGGGRSVSGGGGGRSVSGGGRSFRGASIPRGGSGARSAAAAAAAAANGAGAGSSSRSAASRAGSSSRSNFRAETIQGTLVEVKQAGRRTTLVVRDQNGKQADIAVTAKMQVAFLSSGTEEQLTADQFVSAQALRVGNEFVANQYVIHVGYNQRDLPSKIQPTAANSRHYFVSGKIISSHQSTSQPGKGSITLRVGGRSGTTLQYDPDAKITVRSADLASAPAGASVSVKGIRAANGAFQIQTIDIRDDQADAAASVDDTASL